MRELLFDSVKVGLLNFKVVWVRDLRGDKGDGLFGEVTYFPCEIRMDDEIEPQHLGITLLHEVIHACMQQDGAKLPDNRDDIVKALSFKLIQVLRENPKFTELLLCES